jgi:hypothetical protein
MNYRIRHSNTVHDRKGQYRKGQDRKERTGTTGQEEKDRQDRKERAERT